MIQEVILPILVIESEPFLPHLPLNAYKLSHLCSRDKESPLSSAIHHSTSD